MATLRSLICLLIDSAKSLQQAPQVSDSKKRRRALEFLHPRSAYVSGGRMQMLKHVICTTILASTVTVAADLPQVEPGAGNWRTWIISSGREFRVPPPP